jgi:acetoin utilization deacetylase AcuC-like enzyme
MSLALRRLRYSHRRFSVAARAISDHALVAFYSSHHVVELKENHRFPMFKYERVVSSLRDEGSLRGKIDLRPAPAASISDLELVHCPRYIQRFLQNEMTEAEMRNVGFPYSPALVNRTLASAGGAVEACRLLFTEQRRITANVAGGTHHAFRDRGEGFCVFNDIAISAVVAIRDYGVGKVLIVDLDVHQGNGTAGIFEGDEWRDRVVTMDLFADKCYPWSSRTKADISIPLPDGTGDMEYLALLQEHLDRTLNTGEKPELIIFQAGVDSLDGDALGRLSLTRSGLLKRNNIVISAALGSKIPLLVTMGGGYGKNINHTIDAHTDVYRTAAYRLSAAA